MLLCVVAAHAQKKPEPERPARAWDCPPRGTVTDAAMSPDEQLVALGGIEALPSNDGTTRFQEVIRLAVFRTACRAVDPQSKQSLPATPRLPREVYDMQFTGDGRMLAYIDGTAVYVVRVPGLQRLWKFEIPVSDHGTLILALAVARQAHVAAVLARPTRLPPPPGGPQLMKRPEFMNLLRIYDLDTGKVRADVKLGSEVVATGVALSGNGSRAAVVLRPAEVAESTPDFAVIDTGTGRILQSVHAAVNGPIEAAGNTVWSLTGSADYLLRSFRQISLENAEAVKKIDPPRELVPAGLAVSGDGRFFASTLWEKNQMVPDVFGFRQTAWTTANYGVWDADSGEVVAQATAIAATPPQLSASGRFLLVGTRIFEFDFVPQSKTGAP